jgi:hypothetical protein
MAYPEHEVRPLIEGDTLASALCHPLLEVKARFFSKEFFAHRLPESPSGFCISMNRIAFSSLFIVLSRPTISITSKIPGLSVPPKNLFYTYKSSYLSTFR